MCWQVGGRAHPAFIKAKVPQIAFPKGRSEILYLEDLQEE